MSDSILLNTKKILGLAEDYTAFDFDVITHINTALSNIAQLGIGPSGGVSISDDTTTWDEVVGSDNLLNPVKTYVYLRVRLLFDPPATSYLINALESQLREQEWRLAMVREETSWTPPPTSVDYLDYVIDGGTP